MVDAVVNAASTMTTSHTEVQLFQHDHYVVYYCWCMFIHAIGDCSHQQQDLLMQ